MGELTDATDANFHTESIVYDSHGWVRQTINAKGFARWYTRNNRGEVELLALPATGTASYAYDGNGNVTSSTTASGTIGYSYDNAGQQIGIDYPTGIDTSFEYDTSGRMKKMIDSQGTTNIYYDTRSNVTQLATPQGTINYTYDLMGKTLTRQRIGAAAPDQYTYDAADRLTQVQNQYGQITTFDYDNADRMTKMTFGNGTYSDFGYDTRGRVTTVNKFKAGPVQFRAESYVFNNASQLLSKTISGVTTSYTYDNIGQLMTETSPGFAASYTYDANGNRLTKTLNGATDLYAYDGGDKLLSVTSASGNKTFTYGTLGRTNTITTPAGTTTFNYDSAERVTSLTRSGGGPTDTFAYNGMGARVRRTDAAWGLRIYTRDGLMPASDVLFDGGMNFTPGISQRSGGGQDLYYNDDALGSVTDMTDLNGNIATTRKWDAFGNKSGAVSTHLRGWNEGSGYEEDSASGLRLLGYRYYDPSIGRFLSPDPIGDGSNWYAYCENNPVTYSDPLGLYKMWIGYHPVAAGGWHMYVLIQDNNKRSKTYGWTYCYTGGPAFFGITKDPGNIVSRSDWYRNINGVDQYDYAERKRSKFMKLADNGLSFWHLKKKLDNVVAGMLDNPKSYRTGGPNSNSFGAKVVKGSSHWRDMMCRRDELPWLPGLWDDPWLNSGDEAKTFKFPGFFGGNID